MIVIIIQVLPPFLTYISQELILATSRPKMIQDNFMKQQSWTKRCRCKSFRNIKEILPQKFSFKEFTSPFVRKYFVKDKIDTNKREYFLFHYYARWCMTYICSYFAIITGEQSGKTQNVNIQDLQVSLPFAKFWVCILIRTKSLWCSQDIFCMHVLQQFPKWRKTYYTWLIKFTKIKRQF